MAYPKTKGTVLADKAKSPKPGIPLSKEDIANLIPKTRGNISRIADMMGTTRLAVRNVISNDSNLSSLLSDARERRLDVLEESIWDRACNDKEAALAIFLLKTQGRSRGYEQDEVKNAAQDIAKAAFEFVINKSKNPAEHT